MSQKKSKEADKQRRGEIAAALGQAIRRRREDQALARTDFATRCGLGLTSLNEIEGGAVTPSLLTLEKIAAGFGCSMADLLEDFEKVTPVPSGAGTKALYRLVARLREREPSYLRAVESLLDALDRGIETAQD